MFVELVSGILSFEIFPGDGRKFFEGSSAYNLHSIACPVLLILFCSVKSRFMPNANLICISTKSEFVIDSVTGCST